MPSRSEYPQESQGGLYSRSSRRRFIAGLGGAAFATAFLMACGDADETCAAFESTSTQPPSDAVAGNDAVAAPASRVITHARGEVAVPANPQRAVVLTNDLANVVALGINVVGAARLERTRQHFPDLATQFEDVASLDQPPDVELVLSLDPDLIIGSRPILSGRSSRPCSRATCTR